MEINKDVESMRRYTKADNNLKQKYNVLKIRLKNNEKKKKHGIKDKSEGKLNENKQEFFF